MGFYNIGCYLWTRALSPTVLSFFLLTAGLLWAPHKQKKLALYWRSCVFVCEVHVLLGHRGDERLFQHSARVYCTQPSLMQFLIWKGSEKLLPHLTCLCCILWSWQTLHHGQPNFSKMNQFWPAYNVKHLFVALIKVIYNTSLCSISLVSTLEQGPYWSFHWMLWNCIGSHGDDASY